MLGQLFYAFITLILISETLNATPPPQEPIDIPSLNVHLTSRFLWFDLLQRPLRNKNPIIISDQNTPVYGPRTLGLEYLKIGLSWVKRDKLRFNLDLRPDASLNRDGSNIGRSISTFTGEPYEVSNDIYFLDSYHVSYFLGKTLELSYGVMKELVSRREVYSQLLLPGLKVALPHSMSVLSLNWKSPLFNDRKLPSRLLNSTDFIVGNLFLFQGNQDRSELVGKKYASFDDGPVAKDPYGGMAFSLLYNYDHFKSLQILLGYDEESDNEAIKKELFSEIDVLIKAHMLSLLWSVNLNGRYVNEKWDKSPTHKKSLSQVHLSSMINLAQMFDKQNILFGLHWGSSERHSVTDISSSVFHTNIQLDLGIETLITEELKAQFMIAEEHRKYIPESGQTFDGFQNEYQSKKMLRRFAFAIQYDILRGL